MLKTLDAKGAEKVKQDDLFANKFFHQDKDTRSYNLLDFF